MENSLKNLYFLPRKWYLKVYAGIFPENILQLRKIKSDNDYTIPKDGMWSGDGYINQDGIYWDDIMEGIEITLDQFSFTF